MTRLITNLLVRKTALLWGCSFRVTSGQGTSIVNAGAHENRGFGGVCPGGQLLQARLLVELKVVLSAMSPCNPKDKDEWSKNVVLLIYQMILPNESITFNRNHISNSCYWSHPPESPWGPPQCPHDPFRGKRMQSLNRFFCKCKLLAWNNVKPSAEVAKRPGCFLLLWS